MRIAVKPQRNLMKTAHRITLMDKKCGSPMVDLLIYLLFLQKLITTRIFLLLL